MKSLLWTALVAMLSTGAAFAEDHGGKGGHHGGPERMARMQQHLGLSDDQVTQMREIRQNGGSREEVHAVLSDDQRSQLEEHRAKKAARRAERESAAEQ